MEDRIIKFFVGTPNKKDEWKGNENAIGNKGWNLLDNNIKTN